MATIVTAIAAAPMRKIIAHKLTAEHMAAEPPEMMVGFLQAAPELGDMGDLFHLLFWAV